MAWSAPSTASTRSSSRAATARPAGLRDPAFGNLVFESLLARSDDEPFTLYGLLAETVETPPDRGWVEFTLNPKAKFSDGQPVTVDDVIFSLELLRDKGRPNYQGLLLQGRAASSGSASAASASISRTPMTASCR